METDFSKIYSLMKEDNLSVDTKEFIFNLSEKLKQLERYIELTNDEIWDRYSKLELTINEACGGINEALNERIDGVVESVSELENDVKDLETDLDVLRDEVALESDLEKLRIDFDALDDDFRELVRTDEE